MAINICSICYQHQEENQVVPYTFFTSCPSISKREHKQVCYTCYKRYMTKHLHDSIGQIKCMFCQESIEESVLMHWMGEWDKDLQEERQRITFDQHLLRNENMVKCYACDNVFEVDPEEASYVECHNHATPLKTCIKHRTKLHEGESCQEYDEFIARLNSVQDKLSQVAIQDLIRGKCPRCQHGWYKGDDDDCEHIKCVCGMEFCGLCFVDYRLASKE